MRKALIEAGVVSNIIAYDDAGDWSLPDGALLADIPDADGNRPHIGLAYANGRFEQPAPVVLPATDAVVDDYRDQLVAAGAPVDVGGGTMITMDLRHPEDWRNVQALYSRAETAAREGEAISLRLRDSSNQEHMVSVDQMIALGKAIVDGVDAIYQASWAVKAQVEAGTLTNAAEIPAAFDVILSPAP